MSEEEEEEEEIVNNNPSKYNMSKRNCFRLNLFDILF